MRNRDVARTAKALRKSTLSYVNRALIKAAKTGDLVRIRALIEVGAEVNHSDPYGRTAIMFAALRRDRVMMIVLQQAGAKTDLRDQAGLSMEHYENPPDKIEGLSEEEMTSIIASSVMRNRSAGGSAGKVTGKPKSKRRL